MKKIELDERSEIYLLLTLYVLEAYTECFNIFLINCKGIITVPYFQYFFGHH